LNLGLTRQISTLYVYIDVGRGKQVGVVDGVLETKKGNRKGSERVGKRSNIYVESCVYTDIHVYIDLRRCMVGVVNRV